MSPELKAAFSKVLEWAWSAAWCAGLMYAMHFIEALKAQGGWRAILAVVLTVVGKGAYESLKKYFTGTAAVLFLTLACAVYPAATLPAAPPAMGLTVPAECQSVHDGDTATFAITFRVQVRYLDCWAPELLKPGGPEAAASARLAEGKHGRLYVPLDDPLDLWRLLTFGRVLGKFWVDGATESESERQVRLGFAGTTKETQPKGPPAIKQEPKK
jgi:hypothetical protein